jgi:hypothetical protein
MNETDVTTERAALAEKRDKAERRIGELEDEQRQAVQAREAARQALIEFERKGGGRRAERNELETQLNDAERHAAERWGERIEGARRAARDARTAVQVFTREHLDELVAAKEQEGELPTSRLVEHAQAILDTYADRERVAGEIAQLVSSAGITIRPGDVTFSKCEPLAREASRLLSTGGEERPRLRRDPRVPMHGAPLEAAAS